MHSEPGCPSCLFCNGMGNASECEAQGNRKGAATPRGTRHPSLCTSRSMRSQHESKGSRRFQTTTLFSLICASANMLNCNRYSLRPVMRPYIAFVGRRSSRPHKDANCGRLVSLPADDGERLRPAPRVGKEPCSRPQRGQIHQARAKPWLLAAMPSSFTPTG